MQLQTSNNSTLAPLHKSPVDYSNYSESNTLAYPLFVRFFTNLRYCVGRKYVSFAEFTRHIKTAKGLNVTINTVIGYEKGHNKTAQLNWLNQIAVFMGESLGDMISIDYCSRDAGNRITTTIDPKGEYNKRK